MVKRSLNFYFILSVLVMLVPCKKKRKDEIVMLFVARHGLDWRLGNLMISE